MAVRMDADSEDYTRSLALGSIAALTVCGWFKLSVDRNTWSTIFSVDNGTSDNWLMQTSDDGVTMSSVFDATTQQGIGAMTVGTWYFICLSTSGTTGNIYYRTASSPSLTTVAVSSVTATINAATLRIGESPWGGEWWNGSIAAVRMWTTALSATEALQESMQYVPSRTANLAAWYPLVIPETADYSGNARTLSGGANTVRDDGPPIPWQMTAPRLVLPAASSSTPKAGTDGGTLSESVALVAFPAVSDAGTLSDNRTLDASSAVSDTAALTDTATVLQGRAVLDAGSLTDTASVSAAAATSDGGTLTETVAASAIATATDAAALTDAASVSAAVTATETAALTEAQSLLAASSVTDTATAAESTALQVGWSVTDSAAVVDASSIAATVTVSDSAAVTDASSLDSGSGIKAGSDTATVTDTAAVTSVQAVVSDSAALSDTSSVAAGTEGADAATMSETVSLLVVIAQTDTLTTDDTSTTSSSAQATDVHTVVDEAGTAALVAAADQAALLELASVLDLSATHETPAERTFAVAAEDRTVRPSENRVVIAARETRNVEV